MRRTLLDDILNSKQCVLTYKWVEVKHRAIRTKKTCTCITKLSNQILTLSSKLISAVWHSWESLLRQHQLHIWLQRPHRSVFQIRISGLTSFLPPRMVDFCSFSSNWAAITMATARMVTLLQSRGWIKTCTGVKSSLLQLLSWRFITSMWSSCTFNQHWKVFYPHTI